ncbi:MAG: hypothetical protein NAOJABEB_00223 [Steroidobacteraceae bacterium]|nr:hypothetical protein [Steroidobacteraceae bacterium]
MADRTALLIAFQFPPMRGTSAIQRTLRFAQHLPKFGWRPIVLTATRGAYEVANPSTERDAGAIEVHRALALDAARHLSIFGRYPLALAPPDRWRTWKYAAVLAALRLIREQQVRVVWTTFPMATADEIGLAVAQRSRLPWEAEFRDPMRQGDYPPDPRVNRAWKGMEERIFSRASRVFVTTPGAARDYRTRFPGFGESRIRIVENRFDENAFAGAQSRIDSRPTTPAGPGRRLTLLHGGVINPSERDPTCLFDALPSLKAGNDAVAGRLSLRLRAAGRDDLYRTMIAKRGIDDMVSLEPAIDCVSTLEEMLTVDGLLILQAANCNSRVPAKLYEDFRAGRPIVALTDPAGDTAATVHATAAGLVSPLDSIAAIAATLREFVRRSDAQEWRVMSRAAAGCYSREHRTAELAELFAEVSTR